MSVKLYYAPGTCALAVHIGLIWSEADYTLEQVALGSDEYKKINPLGSVPALLYEGKVMTEAASLLNFIANLFSAKKLLGENDMLTKQSVDQWLSFLGTELHKTYSHLFAPAKFTSINDNDEVLASIKTAANGRLEKLYAIVENHLSKTGFMLNNKLSLLDAYLYVINTWMAKVSTLSLTQFPNIKKHFEMIEKDTGVQRARKEQGI
ncbi:glutathione binding-like protein [Rickettsiales bacterium LUAb2]